MRVFKFFSFWLTLFALGICLYNLSGYDDKNLLLFMTSPLLLVLEDYSSFFKRFLSYQMLIWLFYFLNVFFWCCIGLIIDSIIHSTKRKKILIYLSRIGIVSCAIILISVLFYSFQNSEKEISNILKHPDKYNEQSIRIAVVKSAKEGYGEQYVDEMATILQTTNSQEIYGSTIYALGIIGTPNSIKVIVENQNDSDIISYSLQMNENIIISMLDVNQPQNMINAGIQAAKLLEFSSFIQPLSNIKNNYPNNEVQARAAKVLKQISENPKKNNPKFNID
ncbi:hypothetical protein QFZ77_007484 [Paenibacillus sp. V4I3]|uniref:hypothetical protein n=1 Tax=Paenibacillus sp. V4I3 TaxID=3042305 RepID=UPI00278AA2CC|nr:hypothetical protein [Paenibacillus sp. V4I3]MDQ0878825.1 hypothetical protein [Paenibacillus sp. V4I3]